MYSIFDICWSPCYKPNGAFRGVLFPLLNNVSALCLQPGIIVLHRASNPQPSHTNLHLILNPCVCGVRVSELTVFESFGVECDFIRPTETLARKHNSLELIQYLSSNTGKLALRFSLVCRLIHRRYGLAMGPMQATQFSCEVQPSRDNSEQTLLPVSKPRR